MGKKGKGEAESAWPGGTRAGMASGLIGTMRQSGYAVGFAITASLFAAMQDGFAHDWIRL